MKAAAAETFEVNSFSELCNDQTTLNMESFEERDQSASYLSAQTNVKQSKSSKHGKAVNFSAATSSSSSKYQQELNRLLNLQAQIINP